MSDQPVSQPQPVSAKSSRRRRALQKLALCAIVLVLLYLLIAYLLMPQYWVRYARRHPAFDDLPRVTRTGSDIPGDPLNVALIGSEVELKKIMLAARWYPADALTLKSCLEIAETSVLERKYDQAPVSNLYLFGRRQDLAFEKPVGDSPRHRHHVRFWRTDASRPDGRAIWIGAAVYDERVGFSHKTGQITHVTAPDVDAERDYLFRDVTDTGDLAELFFIDDFHMDLSGRNGGGDPWHTDGRLEAGVIRAAPERVPSGLRGRAQTLALRVVPILAPDIRPMVLLDNGDFAMSDLNDLYRRLINRGKRLAKLEELKAPWPILWNERREVQRAADALWANCLMPHPRVVLDDSDRPLVDCVELVAGRFLQQGKRVEWCARACAVALTLMPIAYG